jgi:hypothetical protein
MPTTSEMIQDASNRVADYAIKADAAARGAIDYAANLINLVKVKLPHWSASSFPVPGTIDMGKTPSMFTEVYHDPGSPGPAPDIAAIMQDAFDRANGPTQAMIDAAVLAFLNQYCPGYGNMLALLQAEINTGISYSPVSDSQYNAYVTQLENGLDDDRKAEQRKIGRAPANGHETPLYLYARLDQAEQNYTDRLAKGRTDLTTAMVQIGLDYRKFCLGAQSSLIENSRSMMLTYAGIIAQLQDFMLRYGLAAGQVAMQGYEAELKEKEGQRAAALAVLSAAIQRSQGEMMVFKTRIEALVATKEFEFKSIVTQIEQLKIPYEGELRVNLEQAQIAMHSGMKTVDATTGMAHMQGGIAQALASGINATASTSAQE